MKAAPLWLLHTRQGSKWFYLGESTCQDCLKETFEGFFFSNWSRKNLRHAYICFSCAPKEVLLNTNTQEYRQCQVCAEPPYGSVPVAITFHGLIDSKVESTFEAAQKNISGEVTVDKTRYSGRPEYTLTGEERIGKSIEAVEHEREELGFDDPLAVLEFHTTTPQAIGETQKKRLKKS